MEKLDFIQLKTIQFQSNPYDRKQPPVLRREGLKVGIKRHQPHMDPLSLRNVVAIAVRPPHVQSIKTGPNTRIRVPQPPMIEHFVELTENPTPDLAYHYTLELLKQINCENVFYPDYVLKEVLIAYQMHYDFENALIDPLQPIYIPSGNAMEFTDRLDFSRLHEELENHQEQQAEYFDNLLRESIIEGDTPILAVNPEMQDGHWLRDRFAQLQPEGIPREHLTDYIVEGMLFEGMDPVSGDMLYRAGGRLFRMDPSSGDIHEIE